MGPLSPLYKMSQLCYCFLGDYRIQSLLSLPLRPSGALSEAPPAPAVPVRPRAPPAQALREGPPWDRLYSLRDGVLGSLDFAEKLLRYAVIEGELAIEHGEEHHTQRPHVTGFSTVRPSCRDQGDKSNRLYNTAHFCSPPPAVKALKQLLYMLPFFLALIKMLKTSYHKTPRTSFKDASFANKQILHLHTGVFPFPTEQGYPC